MEKDLTQLQARPIWHGGSGEREDSSSFSVLACKAGGIVHVTLQCDTTVWQAVETTIRGKEDTPVVQVRGASRLVSPSAPQASLCLGHYNCKALR